MRILIRTSRWAIWAGRLGSFAVPLVITSVMLHRLGLISSDGFVAAAIMAALVAVLAVLAACVALGRLWQTGDRGWGKALLGLFLGLVCLIPYGWYGRLALAYPPVTDLATTVRGQLPLVFEPGTASMPPPKVLSPSEAAVLFPNAETRSYPLSQAQTFGLIEQLIANAGWDVRRIRAASATFEPAMINAQIMTLTGSRVEIVLRVTRDDTSSVVDIRSVSLHAPHDFGANGRRIERFLADLDSAVTILLRDNPNINQPEIEPEAAVASESEQPAAR